MTGLVLALITACAQKQPIPAPTPEPTPPPEVKDQPDQTKEYRLLMIGQPLGEPDELGASVLQLTGIIEQESKFPIARLQGEIFGAAFQNKFGTCFAMDRPARGSVMGSLLCSGEDVVESPIPGLEPLVDEGDMDQENSDVGPERPHTTKPTPLEEALQELSDAQQAVDDAEAAVRAAVRKVNEAGSDPSIVDGPLDEHSAAETRLERAVEEVVRLLDEEPDGGGSNTPNPLDYPEVAAYCEDALTNSLPAPPSATDPSPIAGGALGCVLGMDLANLISACQLDSQSNPGEQGGGSLCASLEPTEFHVMRVPTRNDLRIDPVPDVGFYDVPLEQRTLLVRAYKALHEADRAPAPMPP